MPVDPVRRVEREPGGVAAGIIAPAAAMAAERHVSRAHQQRVTAQNPDALGRRGRVEIVRGDRVAGIQPLQLLHARNIEQHASRHDAAGALRDLVDAVPLRAPARDLIGVVAVVHPAVLEAVAEGIPLRRALERHDHHVVTESDAARKPDRTRRAVGAGDHHPVNRVEAPRLIDLRSFRVERYGEREHRPAFHEPGRSDDVVRRDVVERPTLVVRAPFAPVATARSRFSDDVTH